MVGSRGLAVALTHNVEDGSQCAEAQKKVLRRVVLILIWMCI